MDLFLIAWSLGVISWFIAIFEMIAIHSFVKVVFTIGIPVYRKTIEVDLNSFTSRTETILKKQEGKYKFTFDDKIYFTSRMKLFSFFRIKTPFPFKSIATINRFNNEINIIGRIPVGTTLFLLSWAVGWTSGTITSIFQSGEIFSLFFSLFGLGFVALIFWISYSVEKNRMKAQIIEIKEIIKSQNNTL